MKEKKELKMLARNERGIPANDYNDDNLYRLVKV